MNVDKYYKCFSEDELCTGAELFLSGETTSEAEKLTEEEYTSLISQCKGDEKNSFWRFEEGRFYRLSVSSESDDEQSSGTQKKYRASMYFDRQEELVMATQCSCSAFMQDRYGCPHLAAALTSFYMETEGQDFFRDSLLENDLREISGADDPFAPGVMKRTDSRLRSFLKTGKQENNLPVWEAAIEETVRTEPQLHCEYDIMELDQDTRFLEIKAGEKRPYVVKDIPAFLKAYRNGEMYSLGKQEYILCEDNFRKESLPLIDFLLEMDARNSKGLALYASLSGSRDMRYLRMDDDIMSIFLEKFDHSELKFSDGKIIPIDLERKGLEATLRKKSYGASLKISHLSIFCKTAIDLFFRDEKGIFRVNVYGELSELISSLVTSSKEAYIRESDMPVFVSKFLPVLRQKGNIKIKGVVSDNYKKEVPKFVLYLDLEDKETISCIPHSVYSDPDADYALFDSQSGNRRRNGKAETEFAGKLRCFFDTYERETGKLFIRKDEEALFKFLQKDLPRLQADAEIYVSDRLKRIRVRRLPAVSVEIRKQASSLLMSIHADSFSEEEMHAVLSAYSMKKKYFRMKDGSYFDFEDADSEEWDTLADLYRHYGKNDPKLFAVPLFRALYLDEMLEGRKELVLNGDEHYKNILKASKEEQDDEAVIPDTLKDVLRPYQAEGFRWISRLRKMGFAGILADDMGLGKTLQVLAFLLSEKGKTPAPSLIVCPASLVFNWKKELERFTPQLGSVVIVGSQADRKRLILENQSTDVWITSYDLLKRDIAFYENITFAHEIIDEAQYIKNQSTQAAKSVRGICAEFRLALTGTPIENRLSELWSIMDYLMPGFLYPYTRFQKEFEVPVSMEHDAQSLQRLRRMTHPFILRRMKTDVLKELPEKMEETVNVCLEGEQRRLYEAFAAKLKLSLEKTSDREFSSSKIQVLAEITRLRQICCDPGLVVEAYQGENAKLEACMELVKQAVEGNHKILLFSQFTSMLDIICARLMKEKVSYYRIDGNTKKEKRMEMVDDFAGDEVPVFCISLKAGGTGLNLTAADIVIHYDPWWNQAAQNQATDRTHRIGQTNRVTVYELVAKNTLEEKIQEIKKEKTSLMKQVLSGDTISSSDFNRNELMQLL